VSSSPENEASRVSRWVIEARCDLSSFDDATAMHEYDIACNALGHAGSCVDITILMPHAPTSRDLFRPSWSHC